MGFTLNGVFGEPLEGRAEEWPSLVFVKSGGQWPPRSEDRGRETSEGGEVLVAWTREGDMVGFLM